MVYLFALFVKGHHLVTHTAHLQHTCPCQALWRVVTLGPHESAALLSQQEPPPPQDSSFYQSHKPLLLPSLKTTPSLVSFWSGWSHYARWCSTGSSAPHTPDHYEIRGGDEAHAETETCPLVPQRHALHKHKSEIDSFRLTRLSLMQLLTFDR